MSTKVIKLVILASIGFQYAIFSAYAQEQDKTAPCGIPWQLITEKIAENATFCLNTNYGNSIDLQNKDSKSTNLTSDTNYTFPTNQPPVIKLPKEIIAKCLPQKAFMNLARWTNNSWQDIGEIIANIESGQIKLSSGIENEGFYKLRFQLKTQNNQLSYFEPYAVVSNDWKSDVLAFCRQSKYEIESKPDLQLFRSSIAVSHFDHTMAIAGSSHLLSDKTLKTLTTAIINRRIFDSGNCPNMVIGGLTKIRLRRFEGANIEEFVIRTPYNYDVSKNWSMIVDTDIRRLDTLKNYSSNSEIIEFWWHTISHTDIQWKNYTFIIDILAQKLKIDKNRIYLRGKCQNGTPAMALALNYPDFWAECGISLGNSYCNLIGNATNLPFIFVKGQHDVEDLIAYYDFVVKCFKHFGCENFHYSKAKEVFQIRGALLPGEVRKTNPQHIFYTIESLNNTKAYWLTIDGRTDENLAATIDASVQEQTVQIKTLNVDAYTLNLEQAPVDSNKPVEIIENGQSLGFAKGKIFTKRTPKYTVVANIKNQNIHGPIWDVFTDPYVVIWGASGENKELSKTNKEIAKSIANGAPCFADINAPSQLSGSHNIILIGTQETNLWLSKMCSELPVRTQKGQLTAGAKIYDGYSTGFILVYPNPLNPEKYVAVFSGTSAKAMENILKAYSQIKNLRPIDVGIFEVTNENNIKWHIIENFNTAWSWHNELDRELIVTKKQHPRWQWHRWVAKVLREQLNTDIVICENPFNFPDITFSCQITYRDMLNNFRNNWIVKIKLNGRSLRTFLITPANNKPDSPIIEGIHPVEAKQNDENSAIGINELEDDKIYTVALCYNKINGNKIGATLMNYEIAETAYLIPLLKEYLGSHKELDIESQLNQFKSNVFYPLGV